MGRIVVFGTGVVAYGVIEEGAKAGHQVIHVSAKSDDIAARSNLIDEKHVIHFNEMADASLVEFFLRKSAQWNGALLIPVNDQYIVFISQHLAELAPHYVCTVQPWETHQEIISKNRLYQRCYDIGVPAPAIHEVHSAIDVDGIADKLAYPCILKPYQTPEFFSVYGKKMIEVHDTAELLEQFADVQSHNLDVMVSEIIPGPVEDLVTYVSCLDASGDVLAEFFTQKVRENTAYGVASVIKTVEPIVEIRESSLTLLRHFSYRGFSCAEFKRDKRDGVYKVIEINSRPVLYHRLFVAAGINIVALLHANLVEGKKPAMRAGVPGINWMHNFTEVYALGNAIRSSSGSLKEFFRPYRQPHIFGLPFFSDPKPFMSMLRRELRSLWRRKFGRKRKKS
ncbi:MAG: hypothetical protein O3A13_16340 [Proteobacteria bacterium]|nr:hypothetical protein [Pseudomonadota bacterium]